jgi:phosphonate transport system permease protein
MNNSVNKNKIPPPPNSLQTRSKYLLTLLIFTLLFSYGWKKTEIDLREMVRDAHLVKPLISALLQPDIITSNKESQEVETIFYLDEIPLTNPKAPLENAPQIVLSSITGSHGDLITVDGRNLKLNVHGQLYWVNSIEQEFPLEEFTSDARGSFHSNIRVPEMARGDIQHIKAKLTWKTGGWHFSKTSKLVWEKMIETIFLGFMATVFGVLFALPLGFLGARNVTGNSAAGWSVYIFVRGFFNILRSIEPLVLAILFAVWVGIGPFAGVLALGFHSIAALGKLFSEQIESVDKGPIEAITSVGATPLQVIIYAIIPQAIPQILAYAFYRWDINIRMSTIIGFVGGGGIGFLLQQWINLLQYRQAGTALLAIAIAVITLDALSAKIRAKVL